MNNKITYHKVGDYYMPDLYLEKENYKNDYQIGKYGHLRLQYLKEHKKAEYTIMLLDGTLRKHIVDTDIQAKERLEILMKQMLDKNPIDENLKDTDPLKWCGLMNNYKHSAEEIILKEFTEIGSDIMSKELITTQMKVKDNLVGVLRVGDVDYISLTDLAKFKNDKYPANVIIHWLSNKDTALYVGLWEELNNENFNLTEYREIKINEIGTSSYTMSPKQWIQRTNAIGLISKGGKYSLGTYAHPDLAFEFASWLSVEFKLYLIREFERLKKNESYQNKIEWSVRRELAKTNYRIHTDSIKENIVPTLTEKQKLFVYANEADILNVALFGITAKEWKDKNPTLDGNMRDYANILQLVILSNLENLNSEMIAQGIEQKVRLERLNTIAKKQYEILQDSKGIKKIEMLDDKNDLKLL